MSSCTFLVKGIFDIKKFSIKTTINTGVKLDEKGFVIVKGNSVRLQIIPGKY
jgi:hypothetical protein